MKAGANLGGKFKKGGGIMPLMTNDQGSEEEKEIKEGANKGGRQKKKFGGGMESSEGEKASKRHDRPGRKRGGGVGSDMKPLSSANKTSGAEGHDSEQVDSPE